MQTSLSKIKDYPAFLNEHWALHTAERAKDAPTVISTFAGCGGSSLGYSFAGFKELLAVEWDQNAVDTFRLNFPDVPVYHGDIGKLSVDEVFEMTGLKAGELEVFEMTGLKAGELDVFDGSPPCQGFSTAGKQIMQDERNFLFREYVRLLTGLQPKVFVMENVSGMVKGKMKLIFAEILRELKACGYKVKAVLMNAMYFGVPQSRQRMIFVGIRNDIESTASHPIAQTTPVSVKEAISKDGYIEYRHNYSKGKVSFTKSDFSKPCLSDSKTGLGWKVFYDTKGLFKRRSFEQAEVMPTITKGSAHHFKIGQSDTDNRLFTIDEVKTLASFPPQFQMTGSFADRWARIGNSVPPLLMKAIAENIRQNILPVSKYAEAAK